MAESVEPEEQMPMLTEEEKAEAWKQFEEIIYSNLDSILQNRPAFPVTKFAKNILEDVDLDENGEKILKKKKKKDKKKKKGKKNAEGSGDEAEAADENAGAAAAAAEEAPKPKKDKKKKKKAEASDEE